MNNAELYHRGNTLQKRDAIDCLQDYGRKIKWRKLGERVIDIGCGDGSVTMYLLKEYIPDNFEKLIGCDISENMVAYANRHYEDKRTKFSILDIEGKLPEHMKNAFDHVFSFYTLHWVKDQEWVPNDFYLDLCREIFFPVSVSIYVFKCSFRLFLEIDTKYLLYWLELFLGKYLNFVLRRSFHTIPKFHKYLLF